MRIAIFHDYFRVIGGAEVLVLALAEAFDADIITSEVDSGVIERSGFSGVQIIPLGKLSRLPDMVPRICKRRFSDCDFSGQYDFFIFSGNFSIYAARKHQPNVWYCHTPLKGIYESQTAAVVDVRTHQ